MLFIFKAKKDKNMFVSIYLGEKKEINKTWDNKLLPVPKKKTAKCPPQREKSFQCEK